MRGDRDSHEMVCLKNSTHATNSPVIPPLRSFFRPPRQGVLVPLQLRHHEGSQLRPLPEVAVGSTDDLPHAPTVFRPTSSWLLPEADGEKIGVRSRRSRRSITGCPFVALHLSLSLISQRLISDLSIAEVAFLERSVKRS